MENKRKLRRRKLKSHITIMISGVTEYSGTLIDLSEQGLLFLSDKNMETYTAHDLVISSPDTILGHKEIHVQGVSKWCKEDPETENFLIGFELLIEDAKIENRIHLLMERYCEI